MKKTSKKQHLSIAIIVLIAVFLLNRLPVVWQEQLNQEDTQYSSQQLQEAFLTQKSHLQVHGIGKVDKLLVDDYVGDRHQRFILLLDTGQTVLVAHNIDLAPRIMHLKQGDVVEFYGQYEYNPQGGVVHWTHHDPRGKHRHGWLKHDDTIYQ